MPGFILDVQGLELAFKNRVGVVNAGNDVSLPSAAGNRLNLLSGRGTPTDGTPLHGENDTGVRSFTIRSLGVSLFKVQRLSFTDPGM
jgi:hypothetical protein